MLAQLLGGEILSQSQAQELFTQVVRGEVPPEQLAAILAAMKVRGETPEEIAGAALALRSEALAFDRPDYTFIENCGTGGDGTNTFNISTCTAIVAAAIGLKVAKHGNRSVSSQSGSADMLEQFNIPLEIEPSLARRSLDEANICFLFAPQYHQGIRHAMPVRKSLGVRTLFNLLGPLVNPTRPSLQLMGVYDPALTAPLAETLNMLGVTHGWVVNGSGMDEIALHGPTTISQVENGKVETFELDASDFGLPFVSLEAIKGGTPAENADIAKRLLSGKGDIAHQRIVAANVAALLRITGVEQDLKTGTQRVMDLLTTDAPMRQLTLASEVVCGR